jgi:hypothetical protein
MSTLLDSAKGMSYDVTPDYEGANFSKIVSPRSSSQSRASYLA